MISLDTGNKIHLALINRQQTAIFILSLILRHPKIIYKMTTLYYSEELKDISSYVQ